MIRTLRAPLAAALAVTSLGCQPEEAEVGRGDVLFSEIHYHPVLDEGEFEEHEFVELHNPGRSAVDIGGFRIEGEIQLTLPARASIPARGYLVVAKNRRKLLADVPEHRLDAPRVVGDYAGALDNDGGTLVLRDARGAEIDRARYDDAPPWPIAADAFGASEQFFAADDPRLPFAAHQYRGHSLERVRYDAPGTEPASWALSALDGMTPGRANRARAAGALVASHAVDDGDATIAAGAPATLRVSFIGAPRAPRIERYVEYREGRWQGDDPSEYVALVKRGDAWEAPLPPQPGNTVVRYRVLDGDTLISPRPGDPLEFHAYFVEPAITGKTKPVHLLLRADDWGSLWRNINDTGKQGRVPAANEAAGWDGCKVNPDFDRRVPAVFIADGRVHDVRVRYQGSAYNRWNGPKFTKPFAGVGPIGGPEPLQALSWSVVFPRYARFGGRRHLHLNKLTQACPGGMSTQLLSRLFEGAGIPAMRVFGYYRLFVNGGYYHMVMDREHVDEEMLRRVQGKGVPVGDLWKNVGYHQDQGPWGVGDGRLITDHCGYSAETRYDHTFERHTNEWKGGAGELRDMVEALNAARDADRASGDLRNPAQRKFLQDWFDVDQLLTYKAIANYANAWDDYWQNHFFYKRPSDGKLILIPYDFDGLMAGNTTTSYYVGEQGDPSARQCCGGATDRKQWNLLYDTLFKTHRREYNERLRELDATLLSPENVARLVDEIQASSSYDQEEARQAPGGTGCNEDYRAAAANQKSYAGVRHKIISFGFNFRE